MAHLSLNGLMDQKQREPAIRARLGIQPYLSPHPAIQFVLIYYPLLVLMFWTLSIDIIFPFFQLIPPKIHEAVIAQMEMSSFFVISARYRGLFTTCGSRPPGHVLGL